MILHLIYIRHHYSNVTKSSWIRVSIVIRWWSGFFLSSPIVSQLKGCFPWKTPLCSLLKNFQVLIINWMITNKIKIKMRTNAWSLSEVYDKAVNIENTGVPQKIFHIVHLFIFWYIIFWFKTKEIEWESHGGKIQFLQQPHPKNSCVKL